MKGSVFDIKRFAVHDGPGIRTTVFLKGCPLRCAWCHNPEGLGGALRVWKTASRCIGCGRCVPVCPSGAQSVENGAVRFRGGACQSCGGCVDACPTGAMAWDGRELEPEAVMRTIRADLPFYRNSGGGVTVSGGEPLHGQLPFALELLERCRAEGLHTAVETCLFVPPDAVRRAEPLVDLFIADVKLMDPQRHQAATGVDNGPILENIRALAERGRRLLLRTPLVPGYTADDENLRTIGRFTAALPHQEQIALELLNFNPLFRQKYENYTEAPRMAPQDRLRPAELERKKQILRDCGVRVV